MPRDTHVGLPSDHDPAFPDQCILCHADGPTVTSKYERHLAGWSNWIRAALGLPRGVDSETVEVPCCPRCRRSLWFLAFLRGLIGWTIILGGLVILAPLLENEGNAANHAWVWFAVGVPTLLILVIVQLGLPPCFDFVPYRERTNYHFASHDHALAFVEENSHADWVVLDGTLVVVEGSRVKETDPPSSPAVDEHATTPSNVEEE